MKTGKNIFLCLPWGRHCIKREKPIQRVYAFLGAAALGKRIENDNEGNLVCGGVKINLEEAGVCATWNFKAQGRVADELGLTTREMTVLHARLEGSYLRATNQRRGQEGFIPSAPAAAAA